MHALPSFPGLAEVCHASSLTASCNQIIPRLAALLIDLADSSHLKSSHRSEVAVEDKEAFVAPTVRTSKKGPIASMCVIGHTAATSAL
jgi:hypothetical protein